MATETALDDEQGCRAASTGMAPSVRFLQWRRATELLWDPQCHHHSQNHSSDCQRKPDRDFSWRNLNDYPQKQNPETASKWNLGILSAESLNAILFSWERHRDSAPCWKPQQPLSQTKSCTGTLRSKILDPELCRFLAPQHPGWQGTLEPVNLEALEITAPRCSCWKEPNTQGMWDWKWFIFFSA